MNVLTIRRPGEFTDLAETFRRMSHAGFAVADYQIPQQPSSVVRYLLQEMRWIKAPAPALIVYPVTYREDTVAEDRELIAIVSKLAFRDGAILFLLIEEGTPDVFGAALESAMRTHPSSFIVEECPTHLHGPEVAQAVLHMSQSSMYGHYAAALVRNRIEFVEPQGIRRYR